MEMFTSATVMDTPVALAGEPAALIVGGLRAKGLFPKMYGFVSGVRI